MRCQAILLLLLGGGALCALGLTLANADGPGQNKTPGGNYAVTFEPFRFDIGARDQDDNALVNQGYTTTAHENPSVGFDPDPTIPSFTEELGSCASGLGFNGHGGDTSILVEVYPYTDLGLQMVFARIDILNAAGYSGQLEPMVSGNNSGYAIGMRWSAIPQHLVLDQAIVDIETCCSANSLPWTGARVEFVNPCGLLYTESNQNMDAIWGGLDGWWGWEYRTAGWAKTLGSAKLVMRERVADGRKTTLAPCAKWTNVTPHQLIPPGGRRVLLLFDTYVDKSVDATQVWRTDGGVFAIDWARWEDDTLMTVCIHPIDNVYGTGTLVAQQQYVYSPQNEHAHLDGDATGGPSDWTIPLKHDNNPAATLEGVQWRDGVLTWVVSSEAGTLGYRIQGRDSLQGGWQRVGDLQPPGAGARSVTVGNEYEEYRLVEVEESGREIVGGTASTKPHGVLPVQPDRPLNELRAALKERATRRPPRDGSKWLAGEKIAVFAPSAWTADIDYLMGYLAAWYGVTYQTIGIEQFGTPENRYAGMKNRVSQLYGQGYRYVHLVGDASDWEYFDGPYTTEYWPSEYWETIRQSYFSSGYPHGGDPSLNIIPTIMVKDQLPRGEGVAFGQPYYQLSDMLTYGDIDDDGLPDLAVGRWPFETEQEVVAACYKTLEYIDLGGGGYDQPYVVNVFLGDVDRGEAGEAEHAIAVANAIKSHFHQYTTFREVRESQYADNWQRIIAAVGAWNQQADVALFVSSISSRYRPGNFLDLESGFTTDMIQYGTHAVLVLGASCATADEYRTQDPRFAEAVAHRMLAADNRGAMFWIGPSAGSVQEGNRAIGEAVVASVQQDPGRPVAESMRLALRHVLSTTPPEDPDILLVAKSYQFLGFPLAPLNHVPVVSAVLDTQLPLKLALAPVLPNPVAGGATVTFTLPSKGPVAIRVFDVHGRLVDTIVNGPCEPGVHTHTWVPSRRTGSGQYYLKLDAEGQVMTRTVNVVR